MFKKPFKWTDPIDMHKKCEVCGLDFEPEPGFYFGALIISYGISSWMLLLPALLLVLYYDWSVMSAMVFTLAFASLTYFKIMRLSRSIYLHFSMRYHKTLEDSENSGSKYDKSIF